MRFPAYIFLIIALAGLGACASDDSRKAGEPQTVALRTYDVAKRTFTENTECTIVRAGMEVAKVKAPQSFGIVPNHKPLVITCRTGNTCGTDTLRPLVPKDTAPSLAQVVNADADEAEDDAAFGYPATTTVFMRACKK
jgi:hypothetical protein